MGPAAVVTLALLLPEAGSCVPSGTVTACGSRQGSGGDLQQLKGEMAALKEQLNRIDAEALERER